MPASVPASLRPLGSDRPSTHLGRPSREGSGPPWPCSAPLAARAGGRRSVPPKAGGRWDTGPPGARAASRDPGQAPMSGWPALSPRSTEAAVDLPLPPTPYWSCHRCRASSRGRKRRRGHRGAAAAQPRLRCVPSARSHEEPVELGCHSPGVGRRRPRLLSVSSTLFTCRPKTKSYISILI